jgi:dipeptidyl aminopeptidase/acylaminoacyl peptidase
MHEPYTPEEARLAAALRARAAIAVSEADGSGIARTVIAACRSRRPSVPHVTWLAAGLPFVLVAALLAGLAAGLLFSGGSPLVPFADRRPTGDIAVVGYGISLVSLPERSAVWLSTEGADVEAELAFSPVGRDLAVLDVARLTMLDPLGVSPPRVFSGFSHMAGQNVPAWSPDGTRLALVDGAYEDQSGAIIVLDVETGAATPIRGDITDARLPIWSPDGRWVAFTTAGRSPEVRLVPPDGHDAPRRIADGQMRAWSPDGQQIAVVAFDDAGGRISIVDVTTGSSRSLLGSPPRVLLDVLGWSPDGRELLCWRWAEETAASGATTISTDIGLVDTRSGQWRHVATGSEARLSPDGRWVAFVTTIPGQPARRSKTDPHVALGVYVTDSRGTLDPILVAPNVSYAGLAWRPVAP